MVSPDGSTRQIKNVKKDNMDFYNRNYKNPLIRALMRRWTGFWLRNGGIDVKGRIAFRLAALCTPPFKERMYLAKMTDRGFVEPTAQLRHFDICMGRKCFIGDRVVIYEKNPGGRVVLDDHVCLYKDVVLETGNGGSILIQEQASVHPSCYLSAFETSIRIGKGVMLAPNCALYNHSHGTALGMPIRLQPLQSKGPIDIGDEAWLGVGAIVLSGVTIGDGAVIGAGSVVTSDVPANAIAVGNPARIARKRE
jgi:acetyltransferase-like isoleucine patch superfamily enzyme